MRISFNWLKDYIDVKGGLDKLQHYLTMIGLEVTSIIDIEDDHVLDIEITPNRPDCLSILGVARELAAALDKTIRIPFSVKKNYNKKGSSRGGVKVEIQDKKACARYVGCVIRNVKVGPSPKWLISRLNAMGLRSVNNIVDITNYVLFELGQPLHAFDLDKLIGGRIIVRKARKGEEIITIDGVKRELEPDMLVIADEARPVAVAGIMGGKATEIVDDTKNILLESAYFNPLLIRRTQRKLGLASESSYRFEREVDFGMILAASVRAQEMMRKLAKAKSYSRISDVGGKIIKDREIDLSLREISRVLGIEINSKKVSMLLKRLTLSSAKKSKDILKVKIPSYRQDLQKEIDLIEEVARLYGYDKIPSKYPLFAIQKTYEDEKKPLASLEKKARDILSSAGLNEIVTYSLTSRYALESLGVDLNNAIRLVNPLSSTQEFMRPSLLSEMLEVISWNLNRKNTCLKLFELNKVYLKAKEKAEVKERLNLSIGVCGRSFPNWKEKSREFDFFDLKGVVEIFLESLGIKEYKIEGITSSMFKDSFSVEVKIEGEAVGIFGEIREDVARKFNIKQRVYVLELDMEAILRHVDLETRFTPLPKYPSITRDISILVDDSVASASILEIIKKNSKGLVKSVEVFDLYKGQQIEHGKKSVGYKLEYRSDEKTLKDEEVNQIHNEIQEALIHEIGVRIR